MNTYIKKLKAQLSDELLQYGERDIQSVLDMLYSYYRERHTVDTEEVSRKFDELDSILNNLPLKECDRVWDLTCALCSEHEKAAFQEGIRVGASLASELVGDKEPI